MFITTNLNIEDLNLLKEKVAPGNAGEHSNAAYYQLQTPFTLQLVTHHPNHAEHRLVFTSMSPDSTIYSVSGSEEIESQLSVKLHQHDFYELLFVISGSVYQIIENQRHLYIPGSCCLLNKNIRHAEEYSSDFRVIFFQFSESFLQDLFTDLSLNYFHIERKRKKTQLEQFLHQNISPIRNSGKNYIDFIPAHDDAWVTQNVHSIFEQITGELLSPQLGSSFFIKGQFLKLLHLLEQPAYYQTVPVKIGTDVENILFQKITGQFIETNGRTTRYDFEESLHYSGDYLNKIVKKFTGLNIFDYGMTFCMKKAALLLLDSQMTTSEVALSLGFSNRTHFYKIFHKTYNMTPVQYRKAHKATL